METLICKLSNYSLFHIDESGLHDTIRFVVETNYMHHQGALPLGVESEIEEICQKERSHFSQSLFFVAKDNVTEKIIGSIRIAQWNNQLKQVTFPAISENRHLFHIGRFAVSAKEVGIKSLSLFKTLLVCAFQFACRQANSVILAESDRKLFETFKKMNLFFSPIAEPRMELGSETIPVCIETKDLQPFLEKHKHLRYV